MDPSGECTLAEQATCLILRLTSTRLCWMMLACADSSIDARESVAVTVTLSKSASRGENSWEGIVESHHYGRDHERHCA